MDFAAKIHPAEREPGKFAIYAGDGVYVSAALICGEREKKDVQIVCFGNLDTAISFDRDEAIRACHAARRSGVSAWLVRHPQGACA